MSHLTSKSTLLYIIHVYSKVSTLFQVHHSSSFPQNYLIFTTLNKTSHIVFFSNSLIIKSASVNDDDEWSKRQTFVKPWWCMKTVEDDKADALIIRADGLKRRLWLRRNNEEVNCERPVCLPPPLTIQMQPIYAAFPRARINWSSAA